MEQERDYFGFDEMAPSQKIEVPDATSTNWSGLGDFFEILGVILSEDPNAPARLAAAWSKAQAKLQREADIIYAKAEALRAQWTDGPAQKRYFWFAGAEIYALDTWVKGIADKTTILTDLSSEIVDRQEEAKALHRQFKAEYLASIPAGAAKYGFPPDLAQMEKDDKELAEQVAAIYAKLLKKYTKRIITVGEKLSKNFLNGAKWLGSAGTVPPKYVGADAAKPWRPYSPQGLAPHGPPMDPGVDAPAWQQKVPDGPAFVLPTVIPRADRPQLSGLPEAGRGDTEKLAASAGQAGLQGISGGGSRAMPTVYGSVAGPALGRPGTVAGRLADSAPRGYSARGVPRDLSGVALQGRFGAAAQPAPTSEIPSLSTRGQSILDGPAPDLPATIAGAGPGGMPSSAMSAAMLGMQQQTLTGRAALAGQPKLFRPESPGEVSGRKRQPGSAPAEPPAADQPAEPKPDLAREARPTERPVGRPTLAERLAAG